MLQLYREQQYKQLPVYLIKLYFSNLFIGPASYLLSSAITA
jgi:hypothetical protein